MVSSIAEFVLSCHSTTVSSWSAHWIVTSLAVFIFVAGGASMGCMLQQDVRAERTVHEIHIADDLRPPMITVATGDEVRWTNDQAGPVYIVFLDPILDQLSCHRGFGIAGPANARKIAVRGSLSLCFASAGSVRYTVRLDSPLPTGSMNVLGVIQIEKDARDRS